MIYIQLSPKRIIAGLGLYAKGIRERILEGLIFYYLSNKYDVYNYPNYPPPLFLENRPAVRRNQPLRIIYSAVGIVSSTILLRLIFIC